MWKVPGGWEQTEDGVIPWQAFWLLYAEIRTIATRRELEGAAAVKTGIAMAFGDGDIELEIRDELEAEGLTD